MRSRSTKAASLVSVTLSVDHGSLSLPRVNIDSQEAVNKGLVISDGTGQNDTTITLTGTLADVNAALDGLQYMPDTDFAGTAHLQITSNDLASDAVGGAKTTTSTVAINVAMPSQYSGLLGTYYNSNDPTFAPVSRVDSTIDFNWGNQGFARAGHPGSQLGRHLAGDGDGQLQRRLHVLRHRRRRRSPMGERPVAMRWLAGPERHRILGHNPPGGRAIVLDPHGLFPGRMGGVGQARMVERQPSEGSDSRRQPQLREPASSGTRRRR